MNGNPWLIHLTIGGWDPAFFTDDDGRLYMYNGSSNSYPVYGVELNRKTFEPIGTRKEMYLLETDGMAGSALVNIWIILFLILLLKVHG